MISFGPFCECIKTGLFFTLAEDDRIFTGDLFYDFGKQEFQIRGVPTWQGVMTHAIPVSERGPVKLMLLVNKTIQVAPRTESNYTDLIFKSAKCTTELATFIEEWHGDRSVMRAIEEMWEVVPNLIWTR